MHLSRIAFIFTCTNPRRRWTRIHKLLRITLHCKQIRWNLLPLPVMALRAPTHPPASRAYPGTQFEKTSLIIYVRGEATPRVAPQSVLHLHSQSPPPPPLRRILIDRTQRRSIPSQYIFKQSRLLPTDGFIRRFILREDFVTLQPHFVCGEGGRVERKKERKKKTWVSVERRQCWIHLLLFVCPSSSSPPPPGSGFMYTINYLTCSFHKPTLGPVLV